MRHCRNENVEVYEAENPDLSVLLREVADHVEDHGGFATGLSIGPYTDEAGNFTYIAHLFIG